MSTTSKVLIGVGLLFGFALVVGGLSAAPPVAEKKAVYGDSKPVGPYSPGIDVGDTVYLAGQIGVADGKMVEGGIEAETHQLMKNAAAVLKNASLDFGNVVKTTVFLTDINDFQAMNSAYATYFEDTIPPARSTVAVSALALGAVVEIDFIATR